MDELTIKRLAYVASTADGGCSHCGKNIAEELARFWPEVPWWDLIKAAMDAPYEERFDENDERKVPTDADPKS